jgi:cytochrome c peroxidase
MPHAPGKSSRTFARPPSCLAALPFAAALLIAAPASGADQPPLSPVESLGRAVFLDASLSRHGNQSCASCHAPETGFVGPLAAIHEGGGVQPGSVPGAFGKRKAPSAAYAARVPAMRVDLVEGKRTFTGGSFWDGRATGLRLGVAAAEQAQMPFLDEVEHALPDAACVVQSVCGGAYGDAFRALYPESCPASWPRDVAARCGKGQPVALAKPLRKQVSAAFDRIALALAAYEASAEMSPYSSRFDAVQAGRARFTDEEARGLELFKGKAKCANCHPVEREGALPPVFSDHTYDNLGVPRNPANPWYADTQRNPAGRAWTDPGLGAFLKTQARWRADAAANLGKHKVPTLRNVDVRPAPGFVKSYMHNGWLKSLKSVVHFYNTRDAKPRCRERFLTEAEALAKGCWPEPEVPATVNRDEMGDLKLTAAEEDAIVAFMATLSDGYAAPRLAVGGAR